jgi:SAM-dependent methyltransferase
VQHDFACGTGRAIRMLDGLVHQAHGYDTSPAMLDQARDYSVQAALHEVSEDGPVPEPAAAPRPSLVTIFRFLLNVPEEVRDRALDFAAQLLDQPESGLLVVENHGPRHSLRGLSRRRKVGEAWFAELSHAQVATLLSRHGFHIVERAGFAVCPAGAYRRPVLRRAARVVDGISANLPLSAVATDVLYVAERRR